MKRRLLVAILLIALVGAPSLMAQSLESVNTAIGTFSKDMTSVLPFIGGMGAAWSDGFIGYFPHLGAGLTLEAVGIPYAYIKNLADSLNQPLTGIDPLIVQYGFFLPTLRAEARLGGFGLPFDIGVRFGYLPQEVKMFLPANLSFDYLYAGGDIRFTLIKDEGLLPNISVGVGVNYMKASILVANVTPGATYDLDPYISGYDLVVDSGDLTFNWSSLVVDAQAQISKNIGILTLYGGAVGSYVINAEVGGGLSANVHKSTGGAFSQAELDAIGTYFPGVNTSAGGVSASSTVNGGWGFGAYGGFSLNLFIIRLDLKVMYNFITNSPGGALNLRIQL